MGTLVDSNAPAEQAVRESDSFPAIVDRTFEVTSSGDSTTYQAKLIKYANVWQLFLTYSGKAGHWICASRDSPHQEVFSVRMMLGDRTQEHLLVYARALTKSLCDSLQIGRSLELDRHIVLILAIDVKDDSPQTFKQVMQGLEGIFTS